MRIRDVLLWWLRDSIVISTNEILCSLSGIAGKKGDCTILFAGVCCAWINSCVNHSAVSVHRTDCACKRRTLTTSFRTEGIRHCSTIGAIYSHYAIPAIAVKQGRAYRARKGRASPPAIKHTDDCMINRAASRVCEMFRFEGFG